MKPTLRPRGPGPLPRVSVTDEKAQAVGALLEGVLQGFGIADKVRDAQALLAWEEIAGPRLAERARAIRVHRGKLELSVPSGVWRTHLSFSKRQLLQRLNARLGRTVVRDLVFVNAPAARPADR
ncbi:MAG: DUF721 domain-containing protein [Candidatus Latescibacteria bacterium]|jgi:hypothetical protein|nr:hypothetical protein [Gemmatimonadaceae bacterium]MDP6014876.1 DUF721 domain-containing protein [Candidatus Latescibacterota bacterium]MDP7449378.1 DUF721 domain-containing protein [Candidatus Latescibacterota bacterium]HJP33951.1 DUF721 domain-containing protein [Candidatus Latescibacterota bacterium]|tara:strand:- start:1304 stop:1675 length:372 start_codon:yes stop_codon:yes gene_type:complete